MRKLLRDDKWGRIEQLLPGKASDRGVAAKDNRLLLKAVLWIARIGSPWRAIYRRNWAIGITHICGTHRGGKSGVWQRIIGALRTDSDLQALLLNSTIVRVHQHGAGAQKKGAQVDINDLR
jgi:putative transposase